MRSLTNIRERLTNLESKTTEAFTEIRDVYKIYLNQLEQAVKQQLVFAVHHIATQVYPEIFLALSFSDRARFQQKLRHSLQEFSPKLTHFLASQGVRLETESALIFSDSEKALLNNEEHNFQNFLEVKTPEDLTYWCRSVEQSVNRLLDYLSQEANKILQSVEIINNKLPPQLLEMALHAEENGINIGRSGSPNILNLVIEARQERSPIDESSDAEENEEQEDDDDEDDDDERSSNSQILKITAIHLRLTEIEFADPSLSVARKQLRYLGEQINKLRKQYKVLKREYVKSEAELAWKASWVED